VLTPEEASRCVANEKPDYVLHRTADNRSLLTRPDGSQVTAPGNLLTVLLGADIPIPVRNEEEATAVVQAKTRNPLGLARERDDGEKFVGIEVLLAEVLPGGQMTSAPWHQMGRVLGQGRTWKEALALLHVRVCE